MTITTPEVYRFLHEHLGIAGKGCIYAKLSAIKRKYVIDIFKLEEELVKRHGYDLDNNESMSDFVLRKFGKEVLSRLMIIIYQ